MKIVAVTACPTGIAHTYMAAEALEIAAKKRDVQIRVETRGSTGAQHVLTEEEIKNADCVIIASDINIDLKRFNGKPVIKTSVSQGIFKAEELIDEALSGNVPLLFFEGKKESDQSQGSKDLGFYKHIMNGISHMLPFVVAGGILMAMSYLTDSIYMMLNKDVIISPELIGNYTTLAQFFNKTGQIGFFFMLPVLAGYIAFSIADRPALLLGFLGGYLANNPIDIEIMGEQTLSGFLGAIVAGFASGYIMIGLKKLFNKLPQSLEGIKPMLLYPITGALAISFVMIFVNLIFGPVNTGLTRGLNEMNQSDLRVVRLLLGLLLGGMMAVDLGGPINKIAYTFGTMAIISNHMPSDVMAAVIIGGMIPPLGTAVATTLFRSKFTKSLLETGRSNYVLGISFVTEGAIPFLTYNPKRVLPALVIGSSIGGGLSMLFKVSSPAPHGGVFILPLLAGWDPILFILSLLVGSFITAILLNFLLPSTNNEMNNKDNRKSSKFIQQ